LYLAVLEEMDRQLGPFFDYVRENPRLRNNTLILICSDNGHEPGAGQAGPLKGCKTSPFEGGIRSPLIAWAPGLVDKKAVGTRNRSSVLSAIDLVPSLLNLANIDVPTQNGYDGEELLPLCSVDRISRANFHSFSPDPLIAKVSMASKSCQTSQFGMTNGNFFAISMAADRDSTTCSKTRENPWTSWQHNPKELE
jgi:arylsulfatase A-like enzyme